MTKKYSILFVLILLMGIILNLNSASAILLSDQGTDVKLLSNGTLLFLGNLTIEIYDSATGGNLIFSQTFPDAIVNGSWNLMINPNLEFGKSYWKDYQIDGENLDFDGNDRLEFQSPLGLINNASLFNFSLISYCPIGSAIRSVYENGSVECEQINGSFNITVLSAGGIYLYNDTNAIYLNDTLLNDTIDSRTAYTNGTGLELSGKIFSLATTCADGQVLKWNSSNSIWFCSDVNTTTDLTNYALKNQSETFAGNITTSETGFFGFLGDLLNRITKIFANDIDVSNDIVVGGNVNATGNVTAAYFIGDGSQLTGLPSAPNYTHLSNFTDDLGDRGYTSLSNFTNDMGFINSTQNPFNQSLNTTDNVMFNEITANGAINANNYLYSNYIFIAKPAAGVGGATMLLRDENEVNRMAYYTYGGINQMQSLSNTDMEFQANGSTDFKCSATTGFCEAVYGMTAPNLCYSNGTNCDVPTTPYQSSAAGWTNDTATTNTSLNTFITGKLTVNSSSNPAVSIIDNTSNAILLNMTPVIPNNDGTTLYGIRFEGQGAGSGWAYPIYIKGGYPFQVRSYLTIVDRNGAAVTSIDSDGSFRTTGTYYGTGMTSTGTFQLTQATGFGMNFVNTEGNFDYPSFRFTKTGTNPASTTFLVEDNGASTISARIQRSGVDLFDVLGNGNVMIGENASAVTPTAKLEVNGSLNIVNTTGSSILYANATNSRVGINTNAPTTMLDILSSTGPTMSLRNSGSAYASTVSLQNDRSYWKGFTVGIGGSTYSTGALGGLNDVAWFSTDARNGMKLGTTLADNSEGNHPHFTIYVGNINRLFINSTDGSSTFNGSINALGTRSSIGDNSVVGNSTYSFAGNTFGITPYSGGGTEFLFTASPSANQLIQAAYRGLTLSSIGKTNISVDGIYVMNITNSSIKIRDTTIGIGVNTTQVNVSNGFYASGNAGLTQNNYLVKDVNYTSNTTTYCWMNYTGGLLTASDC